MPTTLAVRFVLGRYHATPWARHVNEGEVELPPSPWRLLRALYATWRTRRPEFEDRLVHGLLSRLATPPTYFVPPFTLAHTRHYYPDTVSRRGAPSTDRTLDAFAVFDRGAELGIRWAEDLSPDQLRTFADLAEALPYLGRADSICEARVDPLWEPPDGHIVCAPFDVGESIPTTEEDAVTVLAPKLPLDLDALLERPVDVRAGKLLVPRMTRFVAYPRPAAARPTAARPRRARPPATAVRLSVVSTVRPPMSSAVAVTDWLRHAAVKQVNVLRGHAHSESLLAGRHADDSLMRDHRHAHYLALPDEVRRVGTLVVWVPGGLADDELAALNRVRRLVWPEGMPAPPPMDLRMSAFGTAEDVCPELIGPAEEWCSVTPFAPARHPKRSWNEFLQDEVRRELRYRGLSDDVAVKQVNGDWRGVTRFRPSKGRPREGAPPGALLRLRFAQPVHGPLALGYLSHFGLGLFQRVA